MPHDKKIKKKNKKKKKKKKIPLSATNYQSKYWTRVYEE